MNKDTTRILVIGAGVNGSICATKLHAAGVAVTVLRVDSATLKSGKMAL